jgi:hypothetical protein
MDFVKVLHRLNITEKISMRDWKIKFLSGTRIEVSLEP